MRKLQKRHAAITIEYLIFSIIVLGIGACLLSFQGEITNTVTLAQSSFTSLQENMSQETNDTHTHQWSYQYEIDLAAQNSQFPALTTAGTYNANDDKHHYCVVCYSYEGHNLVKTTKGDSYYNICQTCGYEVFVEKTHTEEAPRVVVVNIFCDRVCEELSHVM